MCEYANYVQGMWDMGAPLFIVHHIILEECCLQGLRKLGVNANVSGNGNFSSYCVH